MGYIEKREGKKGTTYRLIIARGYKPNGAPNRIIKSWKPPRGMKPEKAEIEAIKQLGIFEQETEEMLIFNKDMRLNEYIEHYAELMEIREARPQTILLWRDNIKLFINLFGHKKMSSITPKDAAVFIKHLQSKNARKDTKTYYTPHPGAFDELTTRQMQELYKISETTARRLKKGERVAKETAEKTGLTNYIEDETRCSGLEPTTIRARIRAAKAIFEQAKREQIIKYNPFDVVPLPRFEPPAKQAIPKDELKEFLAAVDKEPPRVRAICYLLAYTGARRGELYALQWQDLDLEKKEIIINKTAARVGRQTVINDTKTGKARAVPLPDIVIKQLMDYKRSLWTISPWIFADKNGNYNTPNQIYWYLLKISQRYNLPFYNPHRFRHTAASLLISEGVDVLTVAEVLGHSDIKTTLNTYSHALEEKRREASDTMQRLLNA